MSIPLSQTLLFCWQSQARPGGGPGRGCREERVMRCINATLNADSSEGRMPIACRWVDTARPILTLYEHGHYSDVIMSAMASQITSVTIVLINRLFTLISNKASKFRVTGLCEGNSPMTGYFSHKGLVTRKMFPLGDFIMSSTNYSIADWKQGSVTGQDMP